MWNRLLIYDVTIYNFSLLFKEKVLCNTSLTISIKNYWMTKRVLGLAVWVKVNHQRHHYSLTPVSVFSGEIAFIQKYLTVITQLHKHNYTNTVDQCRIVSVSPILLLHNIKQFVTVNHECYALQNYSKHIESIQ